MSERGNRKRELKAAAKQAAYKAAKADEQRKVNAKVEKLSWKIYVAEEIRPTLTGDIFDVIHVLAAEAPIKPMAILHPKEGDHPVSAFRYFAELIKFGEGTGLIDDVVASDIRTTIGQLIS